MRRFICLLAPDLHLDNPVSTVSTSRDIDKLRGRLALLPPGNNDDLVRVCGPIAQLPAGQKETLSDGDNKGSSKGQGRRYCNGGWLPKEASFSFNQALGMFLPRFDRINFELGVAAYICTHYRYGAALITWQCINPHYTQWETVTAFEKPALSFNVFSLGYFCSHLSMSRTALPASLHSLVKEHKIPHEH